MILESTSPSWEQRLCVLAEEALSSTREVFLSDIQSEDNRSQQEAYAACEAITAQYSRSFYLASRLLPAKKRRAMRALYAFCRTADNLADGKVDARVKFATCVERFGVRPVGMIRY
jgi:phytoene synthase